MADGSDRFPRHSVGLDLEDREYRLSSSTSQWRRRHSVPTLGSSDGLGWRSMHVAGCHWDPIEHTVIPAQRDTMISLALDGKMVLDRRIEGSRWAQRQLLENAIHVIPRDTPVEARLHGAGNSIQIYIKDEFVRAVVGDMVKGDPGHLELRSLFGVTDAALAHLLRVARSALDLPAIISIPHADTVAAALVSHLAQYHSNKKIRMPLAEALARPQMEAVICYIHSGLHNAISLTDLATVAGLSISQLIRQFKEVEGVPPHAYIMKARIDKARQLLERNRESIAGIAIDCGFDSQSSLTRAFQRFVGTTPAVYRRIMGKGVATPSPCDSSLIALLPPSESRNR